MINFRDQHGEIKKAIRSMGYYYENFKTDNKLLRNIVELSSLVICCPIDETRVHKENIAGNLSGSMASVAKMGGVGGGESVKIQNILFDWKKLITACAENVLVFYGAFSFPWLIPLACLVLLSKFNSLQRVELNERPASILWTIWINRDDNDCIEYDMLLNKSNLERMKYGLNEIRIKELNEDLKFLGKLKCITKKNNKVCLRESFKIRNKNS